jgi:hypothetical protein
MQNYIIGCTLLFILSSYVCSKKSYSAFSQKPEPVFVDLLRSPGIDSQPGGPVRQPYLTYRPARLYRLAESIPGLLKRLQIRAQPSETVVWLITFISTRSCTLRLGLDCLAEFITG